MSKRNKKQIKSASSNSILTGRYLKQSNCYSKCPHCGSSNISTKHNGKDRKAQTAQNVFIEPLTCEDCFAAVTRYYRIKSKVANNIMLEYVMSSSVNVEE